MIPKIYIKLGNLKSLPPILKLLYDENVKFLKIKDIHLNCGLIKYLDFINNNYPNYYNIYSFARTGVQRGDISRILLVKSLWWYLY